MTLDQNKHRVILFHIIKDIFSHEIGGSLAFKWGTACYFLHWLDRFSTDLDFDLVEDTNIDDILFSILRKYGSWKRGQKIILSYGDNDLNIKIDINRKVWQANTYTFVDFYGTTCRVQDTKTILANKLVALTERKTNRDIYDIYFFLKKWRGINERVIYERTGKSVQDIYKDIIYFLETLPANYKILDGLGELFSLDQKNRIKKHLIAELRGILSMQIDHMD